MSVDFFLDTNVFIYSFDEREPGKAEKSRGLIERAYRQLPRIVAGFEKFLNRLAEKDISVVDQESAIAYGFDVEKQVARNHRSNPVFGRQLLDEVQNGPCSQRIEAVRRFI